MLSLSRRELIIASIMKSMPIAGASGPIARAGAIRWDAWYKDQDFSTYAQQNLTPNQFRGRAPIHCRSSLNERLACEGTIEVMEAEIKAAAGAGLAFWAFDWFPSTSSFRTAWSLYQQAPSRNQIKWCPILGCGELGSASDGDSSGRRKLESWARMMSDSTYFNVEIEGSRRPLMFLYYRAEEMIANFSDLRNFRLTLDRLRVSCVRQGLNSPYIVLLSPTIDVQLFLEIGADALSNYIGGFAPKVRGDYGELDAQIRKYWRRMSASGVSIVPITQVGWDTRPRKIAAPPWDKATGAPDPAVYYELATPTQFAAHVLAARDFIAQNPDVCKSRIMLIYSWSECDEGGCIMPTVGDPDGRYLRAIEDVLR